MKHYVRPHYRNGVYVKGHWRNSPGSRSTGGGGGRRGTWGGGLGAFLAMILVVGWFAANHESPAGATTARSTASVAFSGGTGPSLGASARVVQVASYRNQAAAEKQARALRGRGFSAGVFRSERYRGYRSGDFVVYVGRFPQTAAGLTAAKRAAARLAGSRIVELRQR